MRDLAVDGLWVEHNVVHNLGLKCSEVLEDQSPFNKFLDTYTSVCTSMEHSGKWFNKFVELLKCNNDVDCTTLFEWVNDVFNLVNKLRCSVTTVLDFLANVVLNNSKHKAIYKEKGIIWGEFNKFSAVFLWVWVMVFFCNILWFLVVLLSGMFIEVILVMTVLVFGAVVYKGLLGWGDSCQWEQHENSSSSLHSCDCKKYILIKFKLL